MVQPGFHAGADGANNSGYSTPVNQMIPTFPEFPNYLPEGTKIKEKQNLYKHLQQREMGRGVMNPVNKRIVKEVEEYNAREQKEFLMRRMDFEEDVTARLQRVVVTED